MCKFCETMEENKKVEKTVRGWAKDPELAVLGRWTTEFTVAILKRSWYQKKGKKNASRMIQYRNNGLGFELNYCPECGRKLRLSNYNEQPARIKVTNLQL